MSNMQHTMQFEFLPNEILIECFEYLDAADVFYSFDFLNYRFHALIRNIPLNFNAEQIKKSLFVRFCIKLLLNPQIKKQIISLKISKTIRLDAIQTFFSFFSLEEFSQLRSLTLLELDVETVDQISSILPLLTNLRHFNVTAQSDGVNKILISLSTCTVQTLSVPRSLLNFELTDRITSLINFTIAAGFDEALCEFFEYVPNLQYLHIGYIFQSDRPAFARLRLIDTHAAHLKRLVINHYSAEFDFLEIFFKKTPNLKDLIISCHTDMKFIDACRWQQLITTSLPLLHLFKFKFSVFGVNNDDIFEKYQRFQNDFWHEQHHWYTELTVEQNGAIIYTVPYMSNQYSLNANSKRYYNASMNHVNTFHKVKSLSLSIAAITDSCKYYFSNVKSLRLYKNHVESNHVNPFLTKQHIRSLNVIVDLCNLTHLDISECRMESTSTLLQLLQRIPHISSLNIEKNSLFSLFNGDELNKSFNKMIRKLDVTLPSGYSYLTLNEVAKLCQVFTSMQQFRCDVNDADILLLILEELSKLSHMKVFFCRSYYFKRICRWLKAHMSQLDLYSFGVECESNGADIDDDSDY